MIQLALLGATGRMGERTLALLADDVRFELAAALTHDADPRLGDIIELGGRRMAITAATDAALDVLIDFSLPAGTMAWLPHCTACGIAMVIGATGYTDDQLARIESAAGRIPILRASNFSLGVNLLLALCRNVATRLGDACDVEIIEQHHGKKVDAPSGTALALADTVAGAWGRDRPTEIVVGRRGPTGERPPRQIGIHAVRLGATVSQHEIHFATPEETVTLRHTAHSRDVFAAGALAAAAWIAGRPPGLYSMADVLS